MDKKEFFEKDAKAMRKNFPLLAGNPRLAYLDNAATTQKPSEVIDAVAGFLRSRNASVHRGLYSLAYSATAEYEGARRKVAGFIGARPNELVFTRGTTESINLLAYSIKAILPKARKTILLTELEHHSNMVPWQQMAEKHGMKVAYVKASKSFGLDEKDLRKKLGKDVAIFAFTGMSNATGTVLDCRRLCKMASDVGAISVVDGAQLVPHVPVDVSEMGCDFLAFSSHKMFGPSGVGALYGKLELLSRLPPFNSGGNMIESVSYDGATFADAPAKFEAGTPNIEGAIGFGVAADYLGSIGMGAIQSWEDKLTSYALSRLFDVNGIEIYHPGAGKGSCIISFNLKGIHAHDVASLLDDEGICVRAGHHCAMPLMGKMGVSGTVRASLCAYNTFEDVDRLVSALSKIGKLFAEGVGVRR